MYPIQIPDLIPPNLESNALSWKTFPSLAAAQEFLLTSKVALGKTLDEGLAELVD
ncbi:MAG: hypothetical protein II916_11110 [Oscillospiraceae bacterium]|nr:hypothetical protein [Oscillospiraceae bacterium]